MRFLTNGDVADLVTVAEAAGAVEDAFRALADKRATIQTRVRTGSRIGKLSVLGAVLEADTLAGAKVYSTAPDGRFCFAIVLFDPEQSRWVASLEADELTRIRTAATSLMAARVLARPDPAVLTLFGAGSQAEIHARAFVTAFPLREVRIVHRRPASGLIDTLRRETDLAVIQLDDPDAAVAGADLIVTATRARTPLFDGGALGAGVHITSVGATVPSSQELDAMAVRRAARIVVESRQQARYEAGNLIGAEVDWDRVDELADLASGAVPGRTSDDEITLFDSLGSGLADISVAALCNHKAAHVGRGVVLGEGGG